MRAGDPEQSWNRPVRPPPPAARAPDCHGHGSDSAPLPDDRDAPQIPARGWPPLFVGCHTSCLPAQPSPPAPARRRSPLLDPSDFARSEEHTSELQSPCNLVCRLLLEKKKKKLILSLVQLSYPFILILES